MATIVNARDVILQAASPRFLGVQVGSNIQVPISNVPGLSTALDGTKEVSLQGTSQVYQIPKSGSTTPASITITATLRNLTGTPTFTLTSGTMSVTPALSGGAFTFTPAQMTSDSVTFHLALTVGSTTYTDDWTVVKVREGADALTGFLTNESCTVAADKLGNVTSYTGVSGNFKVFQGATDVTTACTFSIPTGGNPNSLTYSLTGSGSGAGTYSVSGGFPTGVDQTSLTIRATFGSTTIDKVFSISKSKAGAGTSTVSVQGDELDANNAGYYASPRGVVLSSGYSSTAASRGHTLFIFNPANDSITTAPTTYDTYASGSYLTDLIAAINAAPAGHIICLWTYDASSVDSALRTCLGTIGAGRTETWSGTRVAHVVVGMKGLSPGQGYEALGSGATAAGVVRVDAYYSASGIVLQGSKGSNGSNGTSGARGSQTFYVAISGTSFSDSVATSTASTGGGPIYGDVVTQYDNSNNFALSKFWNGSGWTTINAVVDGNLLVQGTVGAQKLIVNNGSGNNLWWDANFQQHASGTWYTGPWGQYPSSEIVSDGVSGGHVARSGVGYGTAGGSVGPVSAVTTYRVPVTIGKQYRFSVKVRKSSSSNAGVVYFRANTGTAATGGYSDTPIGIEGNSVGTSWGTYSVVWTATTPYVGAMILINYNDTAATGYQEWQDLRIEELMDSALIVTGGITADRINTNGLTIRDTSGNLILGSGSALDPSYAAAGTLNSGITISGGAINGIGSGAGTTVANSNISISGGAISGIGSGNGTAVANSSISITAGGVLQGAGGGTVTIAGLDNTVLRAGNPITTGNIGTYMNTAVIGAAYIADLYVSTISTAVAGGATSGGRVEITTNRVDVYDASNQRRVRLGAL